MVWRYSLILVCLLISNAEAEPRYELLPEGSIYLLNSTNQDIVYTLIDNGRTIPSKLLKGDHSLYRIFGPDFDNVYISVSTGQKNITYKLVPEQRYVLYWNRDEARYDVGTVKR